jgi:predicted O-methyltransferase YrrM
MKRWLRRQAKRLVFALHRLGTRLGVHVLPVHYYSAVPDLIELERSREVWARKSGLPGVAVDLDAQVRNLEALCLPYQAEVAGNPAYRHAVEQEFGPGYGYVEAQALHGVVRSLRPRRVIEVGSGVSTWCLLHALQRNREETGDAFSLTCVEPHPSPRLRSLAGIRLIEREVQRVRFDEGFAELGEGDLLFIDSSHTVKPGGDVTYLILEILPRLRPGVVVHVHDIFLPYDYPRMLLRTFFHWMETALLHAFLVGNDRAEIVFCESMLHYERPDALRRVFPEYRPARDADGLGAYEPLELAADGHFPSSIYLRIR